MRGASEELDWKGLYHAHSPGLRRYVGRLVEPSAIDDVVQETFLRAFRNRHSLDGSRPVEPWLFVIARRAAVDWLRRRRVHWHPSEGARVIPSAEEEMFNGVRRAGIAHSLLGLTAEQRRVLLEKDMGAGGGDTSRSLAATKSLLARARRSFRNRYAEYAESTGVFGAAPIRVRRWLLRAQSAASDVERTVLAACAGIAVMVSGAAAHGATGPLPSVASVRVALPVSVPTSPPTEPGRPAAALRPATTPTGRVLRDLPVPESPFTPQSRHYYTTVSVPGPQGDLATIGTTDRGDWTGLACIGGGPLTEDVCIPHPLRDE